MIHSQLQLFAEVKITDCLHDLAPVCYGQLLLTDRAESRNLKKMAAQSFLDWIHHQGGYVNPAIDLFHDFEGGKRGVIAKKDISQGEQLLLIPLQATLFWNRKQCEIF